MRISNIFLIFIFLLLFIGCKGDTKNNIETPDQKPTTLSITTDNKQYNDFVISCGSGCAMKYKQLNVTKNNNFFEAEFKVQMIINEVLSDEYTETYIFKCDPNKTSQITLKNNDSYKIEDQTKDLQINLKAYSLNLCKSANNDTYAAYNQNSNNESFFDLFKKQTNLILPLSTEALSNYKTVSNDYFYFEKENDYYTLKDLKCLGAFKNKQSFNLIYSFNLYGEGESFAKDMIILSCFDVKGKHIKDIIVKGTFGGEGSAKTYKNSTITSQNIDVDLTENYYESETGLNYPITIHKKQVYTFNENYVLSKEVYKCDALQSLESYEFKLKNGFNNKDDSTYGLSYLLDNYLYCFPVTKSNLSVYENINHYIIASGNKDRSILLQSKLNEIK
ncbi:hypothetical protein V6251_12690 [Olleya sp. Ti.3.14]|uniref:hypothetical protein n=1 Tax=Olleya sp. Ti.3.14 TaxID=3121297 RepID=UPI00311E109A